MGLAYLEVKALSYKVRRYRVYKTYLATYRLSINLSIDRIDPSTSKATVAT